MPNTEAPRLTDYVLLALLNLGGDAAMVDIEDIAVEAYRLAPQRFKWRKYDHPSLEAVRVALNDLNRRGAAMVLRGGFGRMLTARGAERARSQATRFELTTELREDDALRRRATAELARIESHPAYARWRADGWTAVDAVDLADIVRCSVSTPPAAFLSRVQRMEAEAARWHRGELQQFMAEAADRLPRLLAEVGVR